MGVFCFTQMQVAKHNLRSYFSLLWFSKPNVNDIYKLYQGSCATVVLSSVVVVVVVVDDVVVVVFGRKFSDLRFYLQGLIFEVTSCSYLI